MTKTRLIIKETNKVILRLIPLHRCEIAWVQATHAGFGAHNVLKNDKGEKRRASNEGNGRQQKALRIQQRDGVVAVLFCRTTDTSPIRGQKLAHPAINGGTQEICYLAVGDCLICSHCAIGRGAAAKHACCAQEAPARRSTGITVSKAYNFTCSYIQTDQRCFTIMQVACSRGAERRVDDAAIPVVPILSIMICSL